MAYTVKDIATALGAEALGAVDLLVTGLSEPATAQSDQMALAFTPDYAEAIGQGAAKVALLWQGADWQSYGLEAAICVERPRYALAPLSARLDRGPAIAAGIHPTAVIDPSAQIGKGAAIAPFVVIGAGVQIGENARIGPNSTIGYDSEIGAQALIHAGVHIGHNVRIGARFICQSGAVIGSDGFSFVTPEKAGTEEIKETLGERGTVKQQHWTRIHSLGGVTIGDDVEVGANTCIDRGTVRDTVVGDRTKIDNMVQVAHNAVVGRDCLLCGASGVAGSGVLGDRVVLGGQSGVVDNVKVGDDVILGGGGKIRTNQPAGRVLMGDPAIPMTAGVEQYKALRRLPRLARDVAALKKALPKDDPRP
ncbi:UDP-3-O-(3-hydroxymyristoyl)glucosamine N-acyltransferase [Nereida sp. MMG025]|uniref:UDP-3-O-(3-hydroxymyristoyl)glucosamine N-acyltransferase n=1 Tax=Nereida sp. MMG025 TaxID=2909981 RepID=UPI001F023A58|nr:UDP-3-O-(3-hydroxymyristoyl)glucosamine N-acyltransferase [Nereida sp. MMG025]MCF6443195.1 UDP-3-O-(3-hydroxymyristoyl)glucosamine N-acyltransferase [Nereida sp. MMG025]